MHAGTLPMRQRRRLRTDPVQSPLETYLSEINETPLLTADEEKHLALRIEEGDSEARDHMVRANLRLVVNIARSYTGKGLGLQDLIAEGNLGLLRAVEGFDPSMNTRFSTYASYWIKWRRATAKLQDELGRTPTQEEIAASLKLPKKKLAIIRKAIRIYNATPQTDDDDGGRSIDETLMDECSQTPESNIVKQDDLHQVMGLLDQMDQREAAVLRLRFGLDGEDPKTLKEIGDRLGLTRERVRQIENEALGKLSEIMAV